MPASGTRCWWVYILRCGDGTLYTGIALDVQVRLAQHQAGKGARYTRGRGPVELVYQEQASSRSTASQREAAIKRIPRREKLRLVESSFHGHAVKDPVEGRGHGHGGPFDVGDSVAAIPDGQGSQ